MFEQTIIVNLLVDRASKILYHVVNNAILMVGLVAKLAALKP